MSVLPDDDQSISLRDHMNVSFLEKLDEIGQRHPGLSLAATIGLALVATVVLLSSADPSVILYEAF